MAIRWRRPGGLAQDRVYQIEGLKKLVIGAINGLEQVRVVDPLPIVARKQRACCRCVRRRCWSCQSGRRRCRSRGDRGWLDRPTAIVAADWIWFSSKAMAIMPPARVVQVIWLTVNMRPSATAAEAGMMTILFVWRAVRTPPTWRPTVDESWSTVYLGV